MLLTVAGSGLFQTHPTIGSAHTKMSGDRAFLAGWIALPPQKMERLVPRYFFTTRWLNEIKEDPHGMYLPNVAAALSYAERRMGELQNESTYDPGLMMIVKDEFRADRFILTVSLGAARSIVISAAHRS